MRRIEPGSGLTGKARGEAQQMDFYESEAAIGHAQPLKEPSLQTTATRAGQHHIPVLSRAAPEDLHFSTFSAAPSMTSDDEVHRLREENAHLRALLEQSSSPDHCITVAGVGVSTSEMSFAGSPAQPASQDDAHLGWEGTEHQLTKEQVVRYSRQIILPSFGAQGLPQPSCVWGICLKL